MSEILILLKLRRRSGVLASAVATLGRCGLEFRSQRLSDVDGPRLDLYAEGELVDSATVLNAYAEVRGVAEVVDILVDGASLLHQPPPVVAELPVVAEPPSRVDDSPASDSLTGVDSAIGAALPMAARGELADIDLASQDRFPEQSIAPTPVENPPVSPDELEFEPEAALLSVADEQSTEEQSAVQAETTLAQTESLDPEEERRRRLRAVMRRRRRYY